MLGLQCARTTVSKGSFRCGTVLPVLVVGRSGAIQAGHGGIEAMCNAVAPQIRRYCNAPQY